MRIRISCTRETLKYKHYIKFVNLCCILLYI